MSKNHKDLPYNYGHQIAKNCQFVTTDGKIIKCTPDNLSGITRVKPCKQKRKS